MKAQVVKMVTRVSLMSVVLLAGLLGATQGQSLQYRIKANIPFDFSIGEKKLSAGQYSIGRARRDSDDTILSVNDPEGKLRAIRTSSSVQVLSPKEKSSLVFHRYGDHYFLFQVFPAGGNTGRQFVLSRAERELQRNLGANSSSGKVAENSVETVTIIGVLE
jgi:hypothetical protein